MKLGSYAIRDTLDHWSSDKYCFGDVMHWAGNNLVAMIYAKSNEEVLLFIKGFAVATGPYRPDLNKLTPATLAQLDDSISSTNLYYYRSLLAKFRASTE